MATCAVCLEREATVTLVLPGPIRQPTCYECQQSLTRSASRSTTSVTDLFGPAYAEASFETYRGAESEDFFRAYHDQARKEMSHYTAAQLKHLSAFRDAIGSFSREMVQTRKGRLFLSGGPGTGKTHLLAAASRVLLDGGLTVTVRSAYDFVSDMLATHASRYADEQKTQRQIIRGLADFDAVIIDDLNAEVITDSTPRYIGWLFMELVRRNKILLIASQLSVKQLSQNKVGNRAGLGPGVMDRLATSPSLVLVYPKETPSFRTVQQVMKDHV